jgi:hypothetical protein
MWSIKNRRTGATIRQTRTKAAGGTFTLRSAEDRQRLRTVLDDGLADLAHRSQQVRNVVDVRLIVQYCGQRSYQAWRAGWTTAWRRQGGHFTTKDWPTELNDQTLAALLVPTHGLLTKTVYHHTLAGPLFMCFPFPLPVPLVRSDPALMLTTKWVLTPPSAINVLLRPPIIELIRQSRAVERSLETFELEWPAIGC